MNSRQNTMILLITFLISALPFSEGNVALLILILLIVCIMGLLYGINNV